MEFFSPENTYSGFRTGLVTAVKYIAWGDGAEIGRKNITRLAFKIQNKLAINPQSVQSVILFAVFRG